MKYGVVFNGGTAGLQGGQSVRGDKIHAEVCSAAGIAISSGDVYVNAIEVENCPIAVSVAATVASGGSQVGIGTFQFKSCTTAFAMPASVTIDKFKVGSGFSDASPLVLFANNPLQVPTIPSADPLVLPPNSSVFLVSGTTGFGNILGGWCGRQVTLIFTNSLTVFDSALINMSANFSATANDTLTLFFDGADWLEIARSNN
jgi:hypothetical protein